MIEAIELNGEGQSLIDVLTSKVRVLTDAQVGSLWSGREGDHDVDAALADLERQGLIERFTVMARPALELEGPVFCWKPGDPEPEFGKVAYRLRSRWKDASCVETPVVMASKEARALFGGAIGGRKPRPTETTHDIGVGGVYLWLLRHDPDRGSRWIPEPVLDATGKGAGNVIPDAAILGRNDEAELIVDFGGAYPKRKLEAFHSLMRHRSYELW